MGNGSSWQKRGGIPLASHSVLKGRKMSTESEQRVGIFEVLDQA